MGIMEDVGRLVWWSVAIVLGVVRCKGCGPLAVGADCIPSGLLVHGAWVGGWQG